MLHCGLLGERLGHSYSPQIYPLLGDICYALYEKKPEELADFFRSCSLDGLNVTVPYKKTVLRWCDTLTPEAQQTGSVNTIVFRQGKRLGCNTDCYGFATLLRRSGLQVAGKKVLILGSGGAAAAVRYVLEKEQAVPVVISRTGENHYGNLERHADAALVVNATPVGMAPQTGVSPLEPERLPRCEGVLDLIYNPARTKLLLDAERLGLTAINGLVMLAAQAKRAAELFLQTELPDERVDEITALLAKKEQNVLLIGPPGCGKTTIGRRLAALTERPFSDTDAALRVKFGCSAAELLERDGEEAFRRRETQVLRELCRQSGRIIATGGGVVTRPENRELLRQNGTIVLLDCPPERLCTADRPLSQRMGIAQLMQKRGCLYTQWAEHIVPVTDPETTAQTVIRELGL